MILAAGMGQNLQQRINQTCQKQDLELNDIELLQCIGHGVHPSLCF